MAQPVSGTVTKKIDALDLGNPVAATTVNSVFVWTDDVGESKHYVRRGCVSEYGIAYG